MELITHFVKKHFVKNPSSWLSLNKAMATLANVLWQFYPIPICDSCESSSASINE